MTKYTSLPNLVRLGQWEQVSEYIVELAGATVRRRSQWDQNDKVDKDDKMDKDDEDNKEEEEDMDKKEKEEEEFFFSRILKMTQYTSLPNLVRLAQWEQVSEYYILHTTGDTKGEDETSSPTQKFPTIILVA